MIGLRGRIPNTSAGNWFQCWMVLFTKEYFGHADVILLRTVMVNFHSRLQKQWFPSVHGMKYFCHSPLKCRVYTPVRTYVSYVSGYMRCGGPLLTAVVSKVLGCWRYVQYIGIRRIQHAFLFLLFVTLCTVVPRSSRLHGVGDGPDHPSC